MKKRLGEQIAEFKGKVTGQRVLDVEGPTIETSVSTSGSLRGTQVNESITYVARPVSAGVLHGKGQGVMMAGESEMATFAGEGVGRITSSSIRWRGAGFYRTSSTGKLSFLNNIVGVFEAEVDKDANISLIVKNNMTCARDRWRRVGHGRCYDQPIVVS